MRVLISYVVDVDKDTRRAINEHYGRTGLATRAEIKRWYEANGRSMDNDLGHTADDADDRGPWEGTEAWEGVE